MCKLWQSAFLALTLLPALTLAGAAGAQGGRPAGPFTKWSKADVEKVLYDSPWAVKQTVKIRHARRTGSVAGAPVTLGGAAQAPGAQRTAELGSAEAPVDFTFLLRLRSARPLREALVRERQLAADYDRLGEKERAAFDQKHQGLLECPACADYYVLTLKSWSKESPGADAVFTTMKGARLADLQRYVYIADERGARRVLVNFVPPKVPGDEAVFYFARLDDQGKALLTPESRGLLFHLTDNEAGAVTNFKVEVSRIVANGAVEF